ncbi:MAG: membrane protein insertion efficiency factor YidD [Candidatus Omnitrophota bacterium]|jgi:putative membrane protein insertion efficiency factor
MLQQIFINLIKIYQVTLRLVLPKSCRFSPSCSDYAIAALSKYGVFHGGFKAAVRLCRCHPFSGKSGYDPLE